MKNIFKCLVFEIFRPALITGIISVVLLSSCDDPGAISFKTERTAERFAIEYADTFQTYLKTVREDSLRSDEFSTDLIGSYYDPNIGLVTASVFTEFRLPKKLVSYGNGRVLDSLVLYLKYAGENDFFGWLDDEITLNVYELNQRIYLDSPYYSSTPIKYHPIKIGTWTGRPKPNRKNTISIKLDPSLGIRILNASNEQLGDDTKFKEVLKGLAIIPENTSATGSIISFKLQNDTSGLVLYFHNNDDTLSSKFQINDKCARVANFRHDFTNTPIAEQLMNPYKQHEHVYLKPLSGVKVNVSLPSFAGLLQDGPIAIHRAEIIFKRVEKPPYTDFSIPSLILLLTDKKNQNYSLTDRLEPYYGGKLNKVTGTYSFVITRYIQDLISQYLKNPDFVSNYQLNLIIPSDNPILAVPLVLANLENGQAATKLKIYYSRLK